jgi:soluble lytic murein transglycosylase-like protein
MSAIAAGLQAENTVQDRLAEPAPAPRVISVVRTDARSGRLVRRIVVTGNRAAAKPDSETAAVIDETAKDLNVSPELVHSVIQVESNYNPYAVSPKGAQGLMQLMPATARQYGVTNSFDARQNIEAGVRYLKFLQDTFKDDRLAIAAYNAGQGAVAKYGGVPPYPETVNYVAKVGKKYTEAKRASEKSKVEAKTKEQPNPASKDGAEEPRHITGYLDAEGRLHIATR